MKQYKFTLTIFYFTLIFTGCEEVLEIDPVQEIPTDVALSSEDNVINILIGAYERAGATGAFGGQSYVIGDLLANTGEVSWNGTFVAPREFDNKNVLVNNNFVSDHWSTCYQTINAANLVLDHLNLISDEDPSRVEGEAKFLRALAYFDLVRYYGAPYQPGQSNSQLGVPLRLTGITDFNTDLSIARSTVEQVYTQIIDDLSDGIDLLLGENGFFADKYAAQALLARVYFQQGNYAAARDAANTVINDSGHELAASYEDAFNNDSDGVEDIFTFQVTSQSGVNELITYYASEDNGGRDGDISIEDEYIELFDDSENDERASFFYEEGDRLTSKYTNQFANVPVIRVAEMHLIRAESNFREGTSVGVAPLDEINELRERSGASPLATLNLDLLFNERRIELGFEGHLLHDYKRTQRSVGDIRFDADELVLPIPQSELDTNTDPGMIQNPGYSS